MLHRIFKSHARKLLGECDVLDDAEGWQKTRALKDHRERAGSQLESFAEPGPGHLASCRLVESGDQVQQGALA